MRTWLLLGLTACIGCGGAPMAQSTRVPSVAAIEVTAADADAAMLGLGASVDPSQGVLVLARLEDPSDGEAPPMLTSGLRCARQDIDALGASLSDYLSLRRSLDQPAVWRCAGDRCELSGAVEFDPTRVLRFARDARGELVVIGVDFFGDAASSSEYVDGLRAEIESAHRAPRAPCP